MPRRNSSAVAARAVPLIVILLATPAEQARLTADGYSFVVEQRNLELFHATGDGKGIGFGAFHTYSETMDQLDALHAACRTVTTAKFAIGTTSEGRTVWALKASDNPEVEESEPEMLFDALHHAREPMADVFAVDVTGEAAAGPLSVVCRRQCDGPFS